MAAGPSNVVGGGAGGVIGAYYQFVAGKASEARERRRERRQLYRTDPYWIGAVQRYGELGLQRGAAERARLLQEPDEYVPVGGRIETLVESTPIIAPLPAAPQAPTTGGAPPYRSAGGATGSWDEPLPPSTAPGWGTVAAGAAGAAVPDWQKVGQPGVLVRMSEQARIWYAKFMANNALKQEALKWLRKIGAKIPKNATTQQIAVIVAYEIARGAYPVFMEWYRMRGLEPITVEAKRLPVPKAPPRRTGGRMEGLEPIKVEAKRLPVPTPVPRTPAYVRYANLAIKLSPLVVPLVKALVPSDKKRRRRGFASVPSVPSVAPGMGEQYAQAPQYFYAPPTASAAVATKTKQCKCPPKRKKSGKPRCSNPIVRRTKRTREGEQFITITRRVQCQA